MKTTLFSKQDKFKFSLRSKLFVIIAFISLALLTKCTVISFYPLYTDDELIRDDRIIGKWMSRLEREEVSKDSIVWEISFLETKQSENSKNIFRSGTQNQFTHSLKLYPYSNAKDAIIFDLHIVKLENKLYFDFLLEEYNNDNLFTAMHLMPIHTFARIEVGEQITVKWFNGEVLEDLLKNNKIRIRHERRKDDVFLLTAKPKELQKFIIKYEEQNEAFLDDLSFILTPHS